MANNKVQLADGTVLIDLTADTADESHVLSGYTFHDKSGMQKTGTAQPGGGATPVPFEANANGVYTAPAGMAYTPVTVNVKTGGVTSVNASYTVIETYEAEASITLDRINTLHITSASGTIR